MREDQDSLPWRELPVFLEQAEREGRAVWLGTDLPRSFVLVGGTKAPPTVYISQLSSSALLSRVERGVLESI